MERFFNAGKEIFWLILLDGSMVSRQLVMFRTLLLIGVDYNLAVMMLLIPLNVSS